MICGSENRFSSFLCVAETLFQLVRDRSINKHLELMTREKFFSFSHRGIYWLVYMCDIWLLCCNNARGIQRMCDNSGCRSSARSFIQKSVPVGVTTWVCQKRRDKAAACMICTWCIHCQRDSVQLIIPGWSIATTIVVTMYRLFAKWNFRVGNFS